MWLLFTYSCLERPRDPLDRCRSEFGILIFPTFSTILSWLAGCNWWRKLEYLVKSTVQPQVAGNFLTCPSRDSNPRQWWETASSQWQHLRPHCHHGRPLNGIISINDTGEKKYGIYHRFTRYLQRFIKISLDVWFWLWSTFLPQIFPEKCFAMFYWSRQDVFWRHDWDNNQEFLKLTKCLKKSYCKCSD